MNIKINSLIVLLVFAANAKSESIRQFLENKAYIADSEITYLNDYNKIRKAFGYSSLASSIVSCMDEALGQSEDIKFKKCYCQQLIIAERIFSKYDNEVFTDERAVVAKESLEILKKLGEQVSREKGIDLILDLSN